MGWEERIKNKNAFILGFFYSTEVKGTSILNARISAKPFWKRSRKSKREVLGSGKLLETTLATGNNLISHFSSQGESQVRKWRKWKKKKDSSPDFRRTDMLLGNVDWKREELPSTDWSGPGGRSSLAFGLPGPTENWKISFFKWNQSKAKQRAGGKLSVIFKTLYNKNPIVSPFCFEIEVYKRRQLESRGISMPRGY